MAETLTMLGVTISRLDMVETICLADAFIRRGGMHQVVTLNAEMLYQAYYDKNLTKLLNNAELITPDGVGIVWAAKKFNKPVRERVSGVDLMAQLCQQGEKSGWSFYFLGAEPGVAERAATNLVQRFPRLKVVGCHDGFFKPEEDAR
jgi:N-acetylglucosaminyldiphosphoundecaprenol N-acetyl-beta-D-mannosaminyltransferase